MYKNEVSFVQVDNKHWLVASHFLINLDANPQTQRIMSYDGAFYMGPNLRRKMESWESEKPASYEEILQHAPENTVHQLEWRRQLEIRQRVQNAYMADQAVSMEKVNKASLWFVGIVVVVAVFVVALVQCTPK